MTDPMPTPLDLDRTPGWVARRPLVEAWAEDVPALVAEVRRLRAVIEAAPHGEPCSSRVYVNGMKTASSHPCNCWKRDALAGVTP